MDFYVYFHCFLNSKADLSDSISEKQITGNLDEKLSQETKPKVSCSSKESIVRKSSQNLSKNPRLVNQKSNILVTKSSKIDTHGFKVNLGAPQASSSFEKNPNTYTTNSIKTKPASAPPKFSKENSNIKKTNLVKSKNVLPVSSVHNASSQFLARSSTPNNFKPPNLVEQRMVNAFKKTVNKYPEQTIKPDNFSKIKPLGDVKKEFLNKKLPLSQNKSDKTPKDEWTKSRNDDLIKNESSILDRIQKEFDLIKEQIKTILIQQETLLQKVSEINDKFDGNLNPSKLN